MKVGFIIRLAITLTCAGALHITAAGAASEKVLYSFKGGGDGANPVAGLIDVKHTLYGTTEYGGAYGAGTVFSITPGGSETVLYSFTGGYDGGYPVARLLNVNGTLYGTTSSGGNDNCFNGEQAGCGTVFAVAPGGTESVVYAFSGQDGAAPKAGLIAVNGTLYGTTSQGGTQDFGTVFSLTPSGAETVLYSFSGGFDGGIPVAGLVDVKGNFYGTTSAGGMGSCTNFPGCGTVFSLTPTGTETAIYRFSGGNDGGVPLAGLINSGGTLYGTTEQGGGPWCVSGCGVVFSITPGGGEKLLHTFGRYPDGAFPVAGLVNVNGKLYGTTLNGGHNAGTAFSITSGGTEKIVHYFGGRTVYPSAGLLKVKGILYGTTTNGGPANAGSVFAITP